MKRRLQGLSQAALPLAEVPDGLYLARVDRLQYRWDKQKPHYRVLLTVVKPEELAGRTIAGRLWATERALWKLAWFLRDFGYDSELLGRDELDEKAAAGLSGVVKLSHTVVNGRTYLNLDAFAPAERWDEVNQLPPSSSVPDRKPEVA